VFLAKRLVAEELQSIAMHLDLLLANGVTPPTESAERRAKFMPTATWETHKEVLAGKGVLSDDDWQATAALFHSVAGLRMVIVEEPAGTHLSADVMRGVQEQRAFVASVYETFEGRPLSWEDPAKTS
jgi:hypothetical protein